MDDSSFPIGFFLGVACAGLFMWQLLGKPPSRYLAAEELCKNNKGLKQIYVDNDIDCVDGATFDGGLVYEKSKEFEKK